MGSCFGVWGCDGVRLFCVFDLLVIGFAVVVRARCAWGFARGTVLGEDGGMAKMKKVIVGIGEALFDVFSDEVRLGGAPLNVAGAAHGLGNEGVVVSRVGQDELGERLLAELGERGMDVSHIQSDPDRATGRVLVGEGAAGEVEYEIVEDAAWDCLQWDFDLEDLAQRAAGVCFGSLAQRDGQTRNTVYRFVESCRRAERLFDVNLREGYYDRRILSRSFEMATAGKMNEGELGVVCDVLALDGGEGEGRAEVLRKKFGLKWVAVTRGAAGTVVFTEDGMVEGEVATATGGGDEVGAGDGAAAALLHGAVRRWDWGKTIGLANRVGAFVASRRGGCPVLSDELRGLAGESGGERVRVGT